MTWLQLFLALLPCLYWTQGIESRTKLEAAAIKRLCVAPDQVDTFIRVWGEFRL